MPKYFDFALVRIETFLFTFFFLNLFLKIVYTEYSTYDQQIKRYDFYKQRKRGVQGLRRLHQQH